MTRAQQLVEEEIPTIRRERLTRSDPASPSNVVKRAKSGEKFNVVTPGYYNYGMFSDKNQILGSQSIRAALRKHGIPHHRKSKFVGPRFIVDRDRPYDSTIYVNQRSKEREYKHMVSQGDLEGLKAAYPTVTPYVRSEGLVHACQKDDVKMVNFLLDLGSKLNGISLRNRRWALQRILGHPTTARILVNRGLINLSELSAQELAVLGLSRGEYASHAKKVLSTENNMRTQTRAEKIVERFDIEAGPGPMVEPETIPGPAEPITDPDMPPAPPDRPDEDDPWRPRRIHPGTEPRPKAAWHDASEPTSTPSGYVR